MKTSTILLIIGVLGIGASIYGMVQDQSLSEHMLSLVCGTSLLYGYRELRKKEKNE